MTKTIIKSVEQTLEALSTLQEVNGSPTTITWQEFCTHPPDYSEWIDGQINEKTGMGLKHGLVQLILGALLRVYGQNSNLKGRFLTEALSLTCSHTRKPGRRPDLAYISSEQLEKYGYGGASEIISLDDRGEIILAKSREYLGFGCREVWLVFPENRLVMLNYLDNNKKMQWQVYQQEEVVYSPIVLPDFKISLVELFA